MILKGAELTTEVQKTFHKTFKDSYISNGRTAMNSDDYNIFRCTLGKNKSEYTNGYLENDPMSLMFTVKVADDGYVVKYEMASLSISPDNKMFAFGRVKLPARKFNAKTTEDLLTKLDKFFVKSKSIIKEQLELGKFDVYSKEIVDMIKSKI